MQRILLLEDDISLTEGLQYSLNRAGFAVTAVRMVKEARRVLEEGQEFDLLLLDVTLPDGTGFELCERIRGQRNSVPVIFLTASDEETSIIRGLDCGGDDYITKPFRLGELCSRIRAALRRSGAISEQQGCQAFGPVTVNFLEGKVFLRGELLELTAAEYRLLCLLLKNSGQIMTRAVLLDRLWDGNGNFVDDNTLSVYIRRLREKIEENPSKPCYLQTVRGIGYQWKE
ncbi:MAG: response regulator transcription factor [Lachnospiraceae bacterium]|nr:response regulator transcription factor [Lachnospiraceae bacterium]